MVKSYSEMLSAKPKRLSCRRELTGKILNTRGLSKHNDWKPFQRCQLVDASMNKEEKKGQIMLNPFEVQTAF